MAETLDAEDPSRGVTLRVPCLTELDERAIHDHLRAEQFFWLDLENPSATELERLGELFELHPLALEDSLHFGQRPKLDDFDTHVFVVFYGVSDRKADGVALREVHLFVSGSYLITVHHDPLPALAEQRSQIEGRVIHSEQFVI